MAWNNNSGGPWGGGGSGGGGNSGGPWGGGGGGNRGGGGGPFGSRRPPDMEDVIRKGQERLKNLMPGGFGSIKGIVLVVLAALVIWLLTGFFRVQCCFYRVGVASTTGLAQGGDVVDVHTQQNTIGISHGLAP